MGFIHIYTVDIIRISDYNYNNMVCRKDGRIYGLYVCTAGSGKMGHFRKKGTDTLQREPHTRRFKTWVYVADTNGCKKAD